MLDDDFQHLTWNSWHRFEAGIHWTSNRAREENTNMALTGSCEWDERGRRKGASKRPDRSSLTKTTGRLILIVIGFFFGFSLWAQTSDSSSDGNKSWTDVTDSQNDSSVNPTRTVASHTQSGNRSVDNQSIQRRDADGNFEPYQDIEKTTVQVNATTVRTDTRSFGRDADGAKTLVQVTEEEKRTQPDGSASLVRATSNPDPNGNLQLVQREIEETKKLGKDAEETKTTVLLPSAEGGLAPAMIVQERTQPAGTDTVESKKTTLLPDINGNWQVSEVQQATTRVEGKSRRTEKRISRPDQNGNLSEVSRTVSKESEGGGEKRATVESYSIDVPGEGRDGALHIVERTASSQRTSPTGQQNTQRQVERPDPGNPDGGCK
jgi:hypothetical protein